MLNMYCIVILGSRRRRAVSFEERLSEGKWKTRSLMRWCCSQTSVMLMCETQMSFEKGIYIYEQVREREREKPKPGKTCVCECELKF